VLTTVDFNDKERLPDSLLSDLVSHFTKHRYRNADLEDPDIFGRAYEYLIREFADDAGKKGGEFYTPREVVRLIVKCVNPQPGHRVYDPCCGSGGMLIYSAEHIRESGGDMDDIGLYGQEKNLNTWAIGQMNVLLHELYDAEIEKGDTITDPKRVTKHDELEVFDRVIANPMWNQKEWNKDWVQENEPHNRFPYGLPPSNRGDWAWIQLMLASLNETGKAGVVMDNGILFRSRSEKKIRKPILEDDLVEAVIALPENLFYNTSSPGCILILNKDKPEEREGKVHFIYAEDQMLRESYVQVFEELSNQNRLTDEGVEYLAETYLNGREEDHHSRLVDLEEIEENDWNLNVPRYVDTTEPEKPIDVSAKLQELDRLAEKREQTETELETYMGALEYRSNPTDQSGDSNSRLEKPNFLTGGSDDGRPIQIGPKTVRIPSNWDTAKLGDVGKKGENSFIDGDWVESSDMVEDGEYQLIQLGNIGVGEFKGECDKFVSESFFQEKNCTLVEEGDLLISRLADPVMRTVEVPAFEKKSITAVDIVIAKVDESEWDKRYLLHLLNSKTMSDVGDSLATGSTRLRISRTNMAGITIPKPPLSTQSQIADVIDTVQTVREQKRKAQEILQELNQGLSQDLITGARGLPDMDS
jgi:type I restriction enzyme M protein